MLRPTPTALILSIAMIFPWSAMATVGQQPQSCSPTTISGQVLDRQGNPVAQATVLAEPLDRPINGRLPMVLTDATGNFRLTNVAPGRYVIHAKQEQQGYPDSFFAFFADETRVLPEVTFLRRESPRLQSWDEST